MRMPVKADEQARELALVTRWSWSAIAGLAAVLVVVSWLAWPSPQQETSRAREYRDYDLCLVTDDQGVAGAQAAQVWAGLHEVSADTLVRRSYMKVSGEQSQEAAERIVATLVLQKCGIIVAVGEHQVAAVTALAPRHPSVRFVAVGGTATGSNLTTVAPGAVAAHVTPMVPGSEELRIIADARLGDALTGAAVAG